MKASKSKKLQSYDHAIPRARQHRKLDGQMRSKAGYTLIEVMIFLAVSGFTFLLAAVFINGKQDNVAFRQGMLAAGSAVSSTINGVADGVYPPLPSGSTCATAEDAGYPSIRNNPSADPGQGANVGCVFLGKALQFGHTLDGEKATGYLTYNVISRQFAPTSGSGDCSATVKMQPARSFCQALPLAAIDAKTDLRQTDLLEHGLEFTNAYRCNGDCKSSNRTKIHAIGFFGSFGSYDAGSADSQSSGAQTVIVAALPGSNVRHSIKDLAINGDSSVLSRGFFVLLCFNRGDKSGSVVIGDQSGQQTSVSVNFDKKEGLSCD